jgi:NAD(P)-dependent dehydrogenase (short-subunit alcohol dehydrogenase family)
LLASGARIAEDHGVGQPTESRGIAIVTGAGSGIGLATATRLAADGFAVAAVDVDSAGLARLAAAGGAVTTHELDVRDAGGFAKLLAGLPEPPAALANVAGVGVAAILHETEPDDWDRVLEINLKAIYLTCRATLPLMAENGGGLIVNVASVAGLVGIRNRAAYCASKAGVIGLTRSIAVDYAHLGIRANAVCPGTVATEWIDKILANAPDPVAARRAMEERQLDGKMGSPEEIAGAIAYLLGPDARFVNGSAFVIDGGMTAA